jgi:hypothetical protein
MSTPLKRLLPTALLLTALQFANATHAAKVTPSDAQPSADDTPIVTVRADGESLELSRADIEALPLYDTELTHYEGPEGRFTGVRLSRFIRKYDLDEARRIRFIGADDYTIFLRPEKILAKEYLLVTRFEGEPIPRNELGPLMLVVPADEQAVLNGAASRTNWIWSVVEIRTL